MGPDPKSYLSQLCAGTKGLASLTPRPVIAAANPPDLKKLRRFMKRAPFQISLNSDGELGETGSAPLITYQQCLSPAMGTHYGEEVWCCYDPRPWEHQWARHLGIQPGASILLAGIGAHTGKAMHVPPPARRVWRREITQPPRCEISIFAVHLIFLAVFCLRGSLSQCFSRATIYKAGGESGQINRQGASGNAGQFSASVAPDRLEPCIIQMTRNRLVGRMS